MIIASSNSETIYIKTIFISYIEITFQVKGAQSAGVVEYTDCISTEGSDPTKNSVPEMIQKHLWCGFSLGALKNVPLFLDQLRFGVKAPDRDLEMD